MEEDIQNYLPTVKFRGTPCTFFTLKPVFRTMTPPPLSLLLIEIYLRTPFRDGYRGKYALLREEGISPQVDWTAPALAF